MTVRISSFTKMDQTVQLPSAHEARKKTVSTVGAALIVIVRKIYASQKSKVYILPFPHES